ncbi:MAG: hypothetical protein OXH00_09405 [Candidatus Poribacteria bacterium]|nr:hypothetical protein [Candidatus Poribacteria bacterium]
MKINSTFHVSVFPMVVLTFCMPFVSFSQQNSVILEARAMAEQDAESDVNKIMWFGAGSLISGSTLLAFRIIDEPTSEMCGAACLLHGVALAGTFVYSPPPSPSRLLGKSPEYITSYTAAYKSETRKIQALWGIVGYISTGLVTGGIIILEGGSDFDF